MHWLLHKINKYLLLVPKPKALSKQELEGVQVAKRNITVLIGTGRHIPYLGARQWPRQVEQKKAAIPFFLFSKPFRPITTAYNFVVDIKHTQNQTMFYSIKSTRLVIEETYCIFVDLY